MGNVHDLITDKFYRNALNMDTIKATIQTQCLLIVMEEGPMMGGGGLRCKMEIGGGGWGSSGGPADEEN